jgi:hypothetical protein
MYVRFVCKAGGAEGGVDKTAPRLQRDFVKRLNEIMQSLRYNDNVDCQGLNLGDQGMAYVGEAFAYNDALKVVDLSSNGIGPDGACQRHRKETWFWPADDVCVERACVSLQ